jgi:hypothetical protein
MIFPNGGYLHLTDKFQTGETVDADVKIGDSVEYTASSWSKISSTTDITYPKGLYIGNNTVMTEESGQFNEEWIGIADNLYTDEDIGDGDGAATAPALSTLLHVTNGICNQPDKLPVVKATCGSVERTVNVAADGSCSGYCSAGQLNMATGVWTTDITWTTAPDNATDITITYRENCFSYSGNTVTVSLTDAVANAYAIANTYAAGCIYVDEVKPTSDTWAETSTSGTYDESTYPVTLFNDGTEEDSITLTFTDATNFTASGANAGSLGSGSISADFSPTNPDTGQPYFTIASAGWGGTWASGDTVTFNTHPCAVPVWWREIVPASTAAQANNLTTLGYYVE